MQNEEGLAAAAVESVFCFVPSSGPDVHLRSPMPVFKVRAPPLLRSRMNLSLSRDSDSSLACRCYASGWSVLGKREKKHRRKPARRWIIVFTEGSIKRSSDALASTA